MQNPSTKAEITQFVAPLKSKTLKRSRNDVWCLSANISACCLSSVAPFVMSVKFSVCPPPSRSHRRKWPQTAQFRPGSSRIFLTLRRGGKKQNEASTFHDGDSRGHANGVLAAQRKTSIRLIRNSAFFAFGASCGGDAIDRMIKTPVIDHFPPTRS